MTTIFKVHEGEILYTHQFHVNFNKWLITNCSLRCGNWYYKTEPKTIEELLTIYKKNDMKIIPEQVIQQEIATYFHNKYCLNHHNPSLCIYSVPNGIPLQLPPAEMARALDLMKKTGMRNGVSDLIIQGVGGRIINVEVKTATGVQSQAQIDFEGKVRKLGGVYIMVRSLADFKTQIEKYLLTLNCQ